ncbi:DUF2069 domain-containing protein [Aliidiomarina minuta]|uniref:DUF2069 domain-containing protein n=1 Tax=Aliidiomarina minuta TaxID=880057 RepID=A0A432W738_9GAMM|nr:DUF2069 domain-containing protein [Aliidiomarina minuta]RUO25894.1 DUF2069 domain-containing protein [Aliidiomarina minuta]
MPVNSEFYRRLTLISYPGLLIFVLLWHSWLAPSEFLSMPLTLFMWVVPLLFPLKGILQGKPYTHAWANFILMLYFLHSLTVLYIYPEQRWLAAIELILVTLSFIGATFYARYAGREQGLGLKKKDSVTNAGKQP